MINFPTYCRFSTQKSPRFSSNAIFLFILKTVLIPLYKLMLSGHRDTNKNLFPPDLKHNRIAFRTWLYQREYFLRRGRCAGALRRSCVLSATTNFRRNYTTARVFINDKPSRINFGNKQSHLNRVSVKFSPLCGLLREGRKNVVFLSKTERLSELRVIYKGVRKVEELYWDGFFFATSFCLVLKWAGK